MSIMTRSTINYWYINTPKLIGLNIDSDVSNIFCQISFTTFRKLI